jgi:hypothetical protein
LALGIPATYQSLPLVGERECIPAELFDSGKYTITDDGWAISRDAESDHEAWGEVVFRKDEVDALLSPAPAEPRAESRPASDDTEASDRTGAPGRPSSSHLVELEFDRRVAAEEVLPTLKAEADWLARWLATKHPNFAKMTPKTIENKIRSSYNKRVRTPAIK